MITATEMYWYGDSKKNFQLSNMSALLSVILYCDADFG